MIKIIFHEMKKIFGIRYCAVAAVLLAVLCFNVPKNQAAAVKLTHTEDYPDKFTLYDGYSADALFQDFLLDTYGQTLTDDDLPDLQRRRDELIADVAEAAENDEVLARIGTHFDAERAEFYGDDMDRTISEADQIYEWSCVNGQMRLDGTDFPIGFIKSYQAVIDGLDMYERYDVLGGDMLSLLRSNLSIVAMFSVASLALIIPYGVSEVKSGTEALTCTTKSGRKLFLCKISAVAIASVLIVAVGVICALTLFSFWDVGRFYDCEIGSAMAQLKGAAVDAYRGVTFLEYYASQLFALSLLGLAGGLLSGIISIHMRNGVSAAVCCLPVAACEWYFRFHYIDKALEYGISPDITSSSEMHFVVTAAVFIALAVASFAQIRKMRCQY